MKRINIFSCSYLIAGAALAMMLQSLNTPQTNNIKSGRNSASNSCNNLFQYGIAESFINGAYKGDLAVKDLKQHGDFGLGAPNLIDGELTIYKGRVYQTKANGKTQEATDNLKTPFAFVSFFKADTSYAVIELMNLKTLYSEISKRLYNPNHVYAISVSGTFDSITTRVFPPFQEQSIQPIAEVMNRQNFFHFKNIQGTLVGFYMPGYMSTINITGFHFHFLSDDYKSGGHVIACKLHDAKIEMHRIDNINISIPSTPEFNRFQFKQGNTSSLQTIEKGTQ